MRPGGRQNLMPVRTDVVKQFLVGRIHELVTRRVSDRLPESTETLFDSALQRVAGEGTADGDSPRTAVALARRGYVTRLVEAELFEPARAPMPGLTDLVREQLKPGRSWEEAAAQVASGLARREPAGLPQPDDEDAGSWRVPGPGGHVRHHLAAEAVSELGPAGSATGPGGRRPVEGAVDLKRCWLYGFYIRCCEESLPPPTAASSAEEGQPPSSRRPRGRP